MPNGPQNRSLDFLRQALIAQGRTERATERILKHSPKWGDFFAETVGQALEIASERVEVLEYTCDQLGEAVINADPYLERPDWNADVEREIANRRKVR